MEKEITKSVEYAYPSSTTATKYNKSKEGCWFVALYTNNKRMQILQVFSKEYEAMSYANTLPYSANHIFSFPIN